jgi:N-acetyl-gamma-glutamyl-phosphate reductase
MSYTAAVAGASGFAGGELLRLIHHHPDLSLGPIAAGSKAGRTVGEVHPQLTALADRPLIATDADALGEADVVFCALPHGQSASLVAGLGPETAVVDLGADFRLVDGNSWQHYYGGTHAGTWVYGLPELSGSRELIREATRVANPGCYPTASILALAPLLSADLVSGDDIVIIAASGTSGAGRVPSESLLASQVMGSMSAYKVGGIHQHIPEIEQALSASAGSPVRVSFTPLLAPMSRGILSTATAPLGPDIGVDILRECLHSAYAHEPFVTVLPEGQWPMTSSTYGANTVLLQVAADAHSGRAVVVAAIDNLVKGAAGQAIQNANLILDLPEISGLPIDGVAP